MKVYLASPFFTDDQLKVVKKVEKLLHQCGFEVFSPRLESKIEGDAPKESQVTAFCTNLLAIENCDIVLAITMNKDMGTLFEAGYACKCHKDLLYFAPDIEGPFNLMLAQSATLGACTDIKTLKSILNDIKYIGLEIVRDNYEYEGEIE